MRKEKVEIKSLKKWCIKEKACAHDDATATAQRSVGQSVKQGWDFSQIGNEEEEEEEDWQKDDEMAAQWDEEQKWEETLKRKRMEGNSFAAGSHAKKVPELVVHEQMSQGEKPKGTKEKKNVKGWSIEEMKDK